MRLNQKMPAFAYVPVIAVLANAWAIPAMAEDRPVESSPGVAAWLAGDAARAAAELASRTDREGVLDRAVARLYVGEAAEAERQLTLLRDREPRWAPALRWLARARAATASPRREETLAALAADPAADSRDFLWLGRLRLDEKNAGLARPALREAVSREPDLYLGWLWLGDAEESLGNAPAAREAWRHALSLYQGGDVLLRLGASSVREGRTEEARQWLVEALATPEGRRRTEEIHRLVPGLPPPGPPVGVAPPLSPGETLHYTARYLFFKFATVEIANLGFAQVNGRRAARVVFSVKSNPGFPLLTIDSRFESFVADDGSVVAQRSTSRDSTDARRSAAYDMDPVTGRCVVRQVVDGLFAFDTLPLAPMAQDGVSVLRLARGLTGAADRVSVLTAVDSTWKGTELRAVKTERISWASHDVDTMLVEAVGHYKGPAGLSGLMRTWISRDGRAVPYKASIKVALGSVVLDLRDEPEGGGRLAADNR